MIDWAHENLWRQTAAIWPIGVPTSLTWHDIGAIVHVIQAARVTVVIEIGVDQGGLAALLLAYRQYAQQQYSIPPLTNYFGVDINLETVSRSVLDPHRAHFLQADAWAPATVDRVRAEIAGHSRALIFCDGGDKPKDLRTYAPILRSGDVLMAHDYQNEYGDSALADLPRDLERLTPPWLAQTLCCLFVKQ